MANYCDNSDLAYERPKILDYGVEDWTDRITEAVSIINRAIEINWYRAASKEYDLDYREYAFDSDLLLNASTQLKRLCVYKSLNIIYRYLSKESPEADAFERYASLYEDMYKNELSDVLAQGLDYDWDGSGAIDYTEKLMPISRRLQRC
jgi:hypothetical protein